MEPTKDQCKAHGCDEPSTAEADYYCDAHFLQYGPTKDQSAGAPWTNLCPVCAQSWCAVDHTACLAHEREQRENVQAARESLHRYCADVETQLQAERATVARLERERDEAEKYDEEDLVPFVTRVVREADEAFERVGGSSRHWVRDCFLPLLARAGGYVLHRKDRAATRVWYEESHVLSLQQRLADAEARNSFTTTHTVATDCLKHGCAHGDRLKAAEERAEQAEAAAKNERERCARIAEGALYQPVGAIAHLIRTMPGEGRFDVEKLRAEVVEELCKRIDEGDVGDEMVRAFRNAWPWFDAMYEKWTNAPGQEMPPEPLEAAAMVALRVLLSPAPREEEGKL